MTQADATSNFDAERMSEAISTGEEKTPHVDVSQDYERSKQYDVSDIDRTGEGAKAAEEATAPHFKVPDADTPHHDSELSSDPDSFRELAKEVNPRLQ